MAIKVTSSAFGAGAAIPRRYTGDGEDQSPPLNWQGVPAEAGGLALICDDPDAPTPEPWVHWVMYQIPVQTDGLSEGVPTDKRPTKPAGAAQGKNSWKTIGYRGPAPPKAHGTHHYHFKLYALDRHFDLKPGLNKDELLKAIQGHILAQGELIGTYERK